MKTKAELVKRWGDILKETIEDLPEMCNLYNDPIRNKKWDFNPALYNDYRRLAVLDYLLNNNVVSFKENLRKAVPFKMQLLQKYDEGAPIDPSRVSMTRFEELFDTLASGDMALSQEYASYLGGRLEAEEQYDDQWVLLLGYSLKYAVENNIAELKVWVPTLKAFYENPKNRMSEFIGYALVLEALLERDEIKANAAFTVLLEGHKKKCKSSKGRNYCSGYGFSNRPDADLFVWGIGLVNLCRYYGLNVQVSDPLIPEELLIPVNNG
jgi:hypothetical protein